MGTVRVKIAHRFLPRTGRIIIWHRQHLLDERGNVPGLLGLFLPWSDREQRCGLWRRCRGQEAEPTRG